MGTKTEEGMDNQGYEMGKMKELLTATETRDFLIPSLTRSPTVLFNSLGRGIIEKQSVGTTQKPLSPSSTPLIIVAI